MKRVLIITYYWPPGSGPGVQRWLKFTKHLPDFGWWPTVITVKNGSYPNIDLSLENEVDPRTTVIKTKTFEPFRLYNWLRGKKGNAVEVGMGNLKGQKNMLSRMANYVRANWFIPDARVGWNRYSFPAALKAMRRQRPDVIITTGPPHSTHLVGERLHSLFGTPWVADLRDPWTTVYYNQFLNRTKSSAQRDQQLETRVVRNASLVLCASPGIEAEFKRTAQRIATVVNGYDEDDIKEAMPRIFNKCTLAYVGNLKANQHCTALWRAMAKCTKNELFNSHFQFLVVGNVHPEVANGAAAYGVKHLCVFEPFAPHQGALSVMLGASALWLPVPQSKGNHSILTGKLFEYLACQRPILSVGPPDGNAAAILHECGHQTMLDYNDEDGLTAALNAMFEAYQGGGQTLSSGNGAHTNYSRRGATKVLSELLNQL